MADTYEFDREIKTENAVIRVYRPILTADERNRRMKQIRKSAEALLKGAMNR